MAALWGETFGHLATAADLAKKYDVAYSGLSVSAGGGYLGGNAVTLVGSDAYHAPTLLKRVTPATPAEGIMGYRPKATALPYSGVTIKVELSLWSGSNRQLTVTTENDGRYTVRRGSVGGTILGTTAAPVMVNGSWPMVEWRWKLSHTVGEIELRVDNVIVLLLTGIDTQNAADSAWDGFEWVPGVSEYHTDYYLIDRSGSRLNDFLGKGFHGLCALPIADDAAAWTPSAGTDRYAMVDDSAPDGGATNVSSGINGQVDRYQMTALDDYSSVFFAQTNHLVRKPSSAVSRSFRPIVRADGTTYPAATQLVASTAYTDQTDIRATDPSTNAAWAGTAAINAARWGQEKVA